MIHHTAGRDSLDLVYGGRADLPGPLAHTHLAKDGTATMVGHGRANHAGRVAQNAFDAVVAESSTHPAPSAASGTVDGNAHFYGIEIENLGTSGDPYPAVQYDAAVRWAAAICRAHGWGAHSVVGHKETSVEGKIDPSFDMDRFRADVAARLAGDPDEEDDMKLNDQVKIADWVSDAFPNQEGLQDGQISVQTALGSGYGYAHIAADASKEILAQLIAQQKVLDKLVAALADEG
ncbi:N-acetylmuramoyl-L-alanine amidase [Streptomyces sulphureus]|uniref:N-acetylmuramoyl-L-alanine amidase n=1 Tax=Streptomyces sulphureus TaxID=47758 RepID=UPI000996C4B4|nr:N-acetylmuramoyl-L-alanine amidase [Streptomyces sulphureus]